MVKWEIFDQKSGITDTMRINILSALRTSIDIHGSSEKFKICEDTKDWLEQTYGKKWAVEIADYGTSQLSYTYYESKLLRMKETELKWFIAIFQQIP